MSEYIRASTLRNTAEKYNQQILDAALVSKSAQIDAVMAALATAAASGLFTYQVGSVNQTNANLFSPWLRSLGYSVSYDVGTSTLTIFW